MDELISIIVPIYKVEPFLDHCISSIINQTYKNLEIILVDDGSPDRCPAICDAWQKRDKRVHVIHQVNSGGGNARNRALEIVHGKFVAFVDSDDYIAPRMFEFLYNQFSKDIDIVECSYCITESDGAKFDNYAKPFIIKHYTAEEAMRENIADHIFRQLIWNKLYRREVIADIRFPVGKKIDDEFWTYQVIGNARKLVHTDKVLYAYRQQENSVMHSLNAEKRLQAIEAKIQRHEYICKNMLALESDSICNLWFTCIYQGQLALRIESELEYNNICKRLEQTLQRYPIKDVKLSIPAIQRIWLKMTSVSFKGTCRIRNWLKIGL